ncbi:alpha/beta fold hydrolase [Marinivivus vitaminiproducens]|uniref:alpha/beta fold hydrolase n=1 Tax=Marinivivus vitaminiproducens TaxID=3035935 RepID=UPI0027A78B0E|nr:alpha/beta hydrolase [Geminicoccaceae bacterium SCSIO 64248]
MPGSTNACVATSDGTNLFVRDWGGGQPIVFVASWSMPSDSWAYPMLALSERGFRCVAFDRRGHGRSDDPGGGYDFDTLADDIAAVMAAGDLRDVTMVGHSVGCAEIVHYLDRHGSDRVARIALVSPTTPALSASEHNPAGVEPEVFDQVRKLQFARDFPQWIEDNLRPFASADTSAAMLDWVRGMALGASLQAVVHLNRTLTAADLTGALGRIDVPTLVIHGDRDVSCPIELTGRRTAELVPDGHLAVYEGAPHGLFVSHHERLSADLAAFALGRPWRDVQNGESGK